MTFQKPEGPEGSENRIRALEFFSGIGGLHYGLEYAHPRSEVVAAFDINEHANLCYHHNFGLRPTQTGIQNLTPKAVDKLQANCWLMSPPCQPYTQGGKQLDDKDPRAEGLLHLIGLLGLVQTPPEFVFVENVPNFEVSRSRKLMVDKLDELGYEIHEFLVTPLQFGIANDRRRYYLTARRDGLAKYGSKEGKYSEHATIHTTPWPESIFGRTMENAPQPRMLAEYLEDLHDSSLYKVPDLYITKRHKFRFDIVNPSDRRCSCFTKAYGSHHVIGSGSFLQTDKFEKPHNFDDPTDLLDLGLRFFTPTEVARLHAFPVDGEANIHQFLDGGVPAASKHKLVFPPNLTLIQQWRLLGNSLNCRVVGVLMRDVLFKMR
ncbi:DNA (cytosine-5-)-methyltransferase [Spizellomyces sp. 'palustris']|nr:DNA (cytosine-5-)-methyltransferase [Spizellomyces sp. 'palustris']